MVPTTWRKSSYSADTVNCIDVARTHQFAAIRDSKNPAAPHLTLPPTAYAGLLTFAASRS